MMKARILPFLLLLTSLFLFNACKNPCKKVDCGTGGDCIDGKCECKDGFYGQRCENEGVECGTTYCLNGGTCLNNQCDCPPCYMGTSCEMSDPDHYIAYYTNQELCDGGSYNYQVAIEGTQIQGYDLVIYNLGGVPDFAGINLQGCSFSIPLQGYGNGNISGSGQITNDGLSINMSYNLSFGGGSEGCVSTLTRL